MGNGAGVQSDGVCARLVAMSMMSSLSAMCDHNDSIFVTFYPPPPSSECLLIVSTIVTRELAIKEILAVLA